MNISLLPKRNVRFPLPSYVDPFRPTPRPRIAPPTPGRRSTWFSFPRFFFLKPILVRQERKSVTRPAPHAIVYCPISIPVRVSMPPERRRPLTLLPRRRPWRSPAAGSRGSGQSACRGGSSCPRRRRRGRPSSPPSYAIGPATSIRPLEVNRVGAEVYSLTSAPPFA